MKKTGVSKILCLFFLCLLISAEWTACFAQCTGLPGNGLPCPGTKQSDQSYAQASGNICPAGGGTCAYTTCSGVCYALPFNSTPCATSPQNNQSYQLVSSCDGGVCESTCNSSYQINGTQCSLIGTATNTNTDTNTNTITIWSTQTDTDTASQTFTNTPTDTNTLTQTFTNTPTDTNTLTQTFTDTPTDTNTIIDTNTNTITIWSTQTDTDTASQTFTNTLTNTDTNTIIGTFAGTGTDTGTWTITGTGTGTNTGTTIGTGSGTSSGTNTGTSTGTGTGTSAGICGDGIIPEGSKECDYNAANPTNSVTCQTLGYSGGTLGCIPASGQNACGTSGYVPCAFDTCNCTNNSCPLTCLYENVGTLPCPGTTPTVQNYSYSVVATESDCPAGGGTCVSYCDGSSGYQYSNGECILVNTNTAVGTGTTTSTNTDTDTATVNCTLGSIPFSCGIPGGIVEDYGPLNNGQTTGSQGCPGLCTGSWSATCNNGNNVVSNNCVYVNENCSGGGHGLPECATGVGIGPINNGSSAGPFSCAGVGSCIGGTYSASCSNTVVTFTDNCVPGPGTNTDTNVLTDTLTNADTNTLTNTDTDTDTGGCTGAYNVGSCGNASVGMEGYSLSNGQTTGPQGCPGLCAGSGSWSVTCNNGTPSFSSSCVNLSCPSGGTGPALAACEDAAIYGNLNNGQIYTTSCAGLGICTGGTWSATCTNGSVAITNNCIVGPGTNTLTDTDTDTDTLNCSTDVIVGQIPECGGGHGGMTEYEGPAINNGLTSAQQSCNGSCSGYWTVTCNNGTYSLNDNCVAGPGTDSNTDTNTDTGTGTGTEIIPSTDLNCSSGDWVPGEGCNWSNPSTPGCSNQCTCVKGCSNGTCYCGSSDINCNAGTSSNNCQCNQGTGPNGDNYINDGAGNCTLCGNQSFPEAGKECDQGQSPPSWCQSCQCVGDATHCKGTDSNCDGHPGSASNNNNCQCVSPYVNDGSGNCVLCGNGTLDSGEQCDFGGSNHTDTTTPGCSSQCTCVAGNINGNWYCGTGDPNCDSGTANNNCQCNSGYTLDTNPDDTGHYLTCLPNAPGSCVTAADCAPSSGLPYACSDSNGDTSSCNACCGGHCTNTNFDSSNCGSCGAASCQGSVCSGGTCSLCGTGSEGSAPPTGEQCDFGGSNNPNTTSPGCSSQCTCVKGCTDGKCYCGSSDVNCDAGSSSNNCQCNQGTGPNGENYVNDGSGNCVLCGNNHIDSSEECDIGQTSSTWCQSCQCVGDATHCKGTDKNCDGYPGSASNNNDCQCVSPYVNDGSGNCVLCGNGTLDSGEQCDTGYWNKQPWCQNCQCTGDYKTHCSASDPNCNHTDANCDCNANYTLDTNPDDTGYYGLCLPNNPGSCNVTTDCAPTSGLPYACNDSNGHISACTACCNGSCSSTNFDSNNCGGCWANCPNGTTCWDGTCGGCTPMTCAQWTKNYGTTPCGLIPDGCGGTIDCGVCTAPQTCGAGGQANVCGGSCINDSDCTGTDPTTGGPATKCCNNTCIDPKANVNNCGACGTYCPTTSTSSCSNGSCTCQGDGDCQPQTQYGPNGCCGSNGICAWPNLYGNDSNNCGACADQGGTCSGSTPTCCSGQCVNTGSDTNNCGACNSSCAGTCAGGSCSCPDGTSCPSGSGNTCCSNGSGGYTCTALDSDFNSCGFCNSPGQPSDCSITFDPYTGQLDYDQCCGGGCVDTQTDPNNCGGCGIICPTSLGNSQYTCLGGQCLQYCTADWQCNSYFDQDSCCPVSTPGCNLQTNTCNSPGSSDGRQCVFATATCSCECGGACGTSGVTCGQCERCTGKYEWNGGDPCYASGYSWKVTCGGITACAGNCEDP